MKPKAKSYAGCPKLTPLLSMCSQAFLIESESIISLLMFLMMIMLVVMMIVIILIMLVMMMMMMVVVVVVVKMMAVIMFGDSFILQLSLYTTGDIMYIYNRAIVTQF